MSDYISYMLVITVFLSGLAYCYGNRIDKLPSGRVDFDAEFDCDKLAEKLDIGEETFVRECHAVLSSDVIKETREYVKKARKEEISDAMNEFFDLPGIRRKRSTVGCPRFNRQYLMENNDSPMMRSTSPSEAYLEYDLNRFPRYILQRRCLCKGCINPYTGLEDLRLNSTLISARIPVFFSNGTRGTFDVHVGCTCLI